MRPARILAVTASAVLGVALGVGAALALDIQPAQDPLGLGAPMVNQACQEHQAVLVLASGVTGGALASDLASRDGARYLETANSCRTAWRRAGRPIERYVAYLGPFSRSAACAKQMTGDYRGAHVTMLAQDTPDTETCACFVSRDGIYLHDVQTMLTQLKYRPDEPITNSYDQELESQVRLFQQARDQKANGVMNADIWQALLNAACDQN